MKSSSPPALPTEPDIYPRDEHPISRRNIDPDALKIMLRLIQHGYKAYLVGGGVRDLLIGKQPKDFDIATDATPNKVKGLFRNCRIIGRRFKLAHVFFRGGKIIEVATFRDAGAPPETFDEAEVLADIEAPPPPTKLKIDENRYGTEATDALRRDLTINGLFYDISSFSIIDYVGGMPDIKKRIIRIIGDPATRIREDPVRMIRVIRHAVKSGFRIEDETLSAVLDHHELISVCPAMRVYEEIKKDLSSGYFLGITRMLASCRLLVHLLPELLAHEGHLLSDGSLFAQVVSTADSWARDGRALSPTTMLCIMALFFTSPTGMHAASGEELAQAFQDDRALRASMENAFSSLAVPRREREAITLLARQWWHEVTGGKLSSGGAPTRSRRGRMGRGGVAATAERRDGAAEDLEMLRELLR